MILYVNGCSWSSMSNTDLTGKVYGDFLADKFGAQLINHAIPGSSNLRIIRTAIKDINNLKNKDDIVCILNIHQQFRLEAWLDFTQKNLIDNTLLTPLEQAIKERYKRANDGDYISYSVTEPGIIGQLPVYKNLEKSSITFDHYERHFYELYYHLTLASAYFKQNNIKYLIFAGCDLINIDDLTKSDLEFINIFRNTVESDPAILNFSNINFCQWAYDRNLKCFDTSNDPARPWIGHPDEEAHAVWADFLYNKLKELYEI